MTALCTVSYCPAKKDPDWHRCFVCQNNTIEHHHVKSRGMGGSKKRRDDPLNVVALCHSHHEMVTLHECSDDILDFPGRGKFYVYFGLHGETLIEKEVMPDADRQPQEFDQREVGRDGQVLSAAAEAEGTSRSPGRTLPKVNKISGLAAAPSAGLGGEAATPPQVSPSPPLLTKEESDEQTDGQEADVLPLQDAPEDNDVLGGHGSRDLPPVREGARGSVRPERSEGVDKRVPLSHEQRVAIAWHIKNAQQQRQFLAGDTANQWEEELNEDFWNLYANELGYTYPSLRNAMRVCRKIPQDQRHDEMSFAHHEAVQSFDRETREAWLERAFEEEWPVKRLREELVAEGLLTAKKKTKRWAVAEMRELIQEFLRWQADPLPVSAIKDDGGSAENFCTFLEERP